MTDYMEAYRAWLNHAGLDGQTQKELLELQDDDCEIYERFYQDLAFGTGGLRGVIGAGTNRMNRYTVRRATLGYARYLKQTAGEDACRRGVVIAHDNRRMSRIFCMETAGVLAANGIKAYIFDALRPTPSFPLPCAVLVRQAAW